MGERGYLEAVCRCQRLSARAFCPVWDPDTGRPDAMWSATAQPSGQGGYGTCLLKALLWLSLLPQHAQVTTSASSNSATNMTTIQATRNTPSLSQGKQAEARVTPPPKVEGWFPVGAFPSPLPSEHRQLEGPAGLYVKREGLETGELGRNGLPGSCLSLPSLLSSGSRLCYGCTTTVYIGLRGESLK